MGVVLDKLRQEYAEEEAGRKWYQRRPKGDAVLYLSARMRDAENEKREAEQLAYATEMAAIDILRRYDGDGSLVQEFHQRIKEIRREK